MRVVTVRLFLCNAGSMQSIKSWYTWCVSNANRSRIHGRSRRYFRRSRRARRQRPVGVWWRVGRCQSIKTTLARVLVILWWPDFLNGCPRRQMATRQENKETNERQSMRRPSRKMRFPMAFKGIFDVQKRRNVRWWQDPNHRGIGWIHPKASI